MFEWITRLVSDGGYLGVAGLMLLENLFPPIPSELIMPLAGFVAARGELQIALVVLAGTLGSIAGTLPWYYAGRWLGRDRLRRLAARHGRWLTVSPEEFDRASAWFDRHGGLAVLIGRLVPGVRTLISVPAGIAGMGLGRFLLLSAIGSLAWTAALTLAGYALEDHYAVVADYVDPASKAVLGAVVLLYLYRLVTFRSFPHR
jgi:membrane protein DedA with SNARE-associated domain